RRAHLAFAQLPTLGVGERRAEILGFADDARIAHAHELVAHLDRDVFQGALDDGAGDRIDTRCRLLATVRAVNIVHFRTSPPASGRHHLRAESTWKGARSASAPPRCFIIASRRRGRLSCSIARLRIPHAEVLSRRGLPIMAYGLR